MMAIRKMWRAFVTRWEAIADMKAAELRHGITLIEAASYDQRRIELAAVVGPINVDTYMEGAVEMAKLGIWPDELEQMGRLHSRARTLGIDDNETYMRLLRLADK